MLARPERTSTSASFIQASRRRARSSAISASRRSRVWSSRRSISRKALDRLECVVTVDIGAEPFVRECAICIRHEIRKGLRLRDGRRACQRRWPRLRFVRREVDVEEVGHTTRRSPHRSRRASALGRTGSHRSRSHPKRRLQCRQLLRDRAERSRVAARARAADVLLAQLRRASVQVARRRRNSSIESRQRRISWLAACGSCSAAIARCESTATLRSDMSSRAVPTTATRQRLDRLGELVANLLERTVRLRSDEHSLSLR